MKRSFPANAVAFFQIVSGLRDDLAGGRRRSAVYCPPRRKGVATAGTAPELAHANQCGGRAGRHEPSPGDTHEL